MLHTRVQSACKFSFSKMFKTRVCLTIRFFFLFTSDSCLGNEIIFFFYFTLAELRLNMYGGSFDNGRALPEMYRERVLDLYLSSPSFVQKVIDRYNEQNISLRGIRVGFPSPKIDEQVVEYIEVQKLMKPST